jgi:drug/metabolite transporter (DMT)-like permease
MRILQILSVILIAAGIFLIVRPFHYGTDESVMKFGSFQATVRQEKTLPGWVGGVVLGGGVALLGTALFKRT